VCVAKTPLGPRNQHLSFSWCPGSGDTTVGVFDLFLAVVAALSVFFRTRAGASLEILARASKLLYSNANELAHE
jgi:hypothetical protein